MKNNKERLLQGVTVLLDIAIIVSTYVCVAAFFTTGQGGNMTGAGFLVFRYFTIDSNVLMALASALALPRGLRAFLGKERELPLWLTILRFSGAVSVTVTLLVVVFFLGPTKGYGRMFAGGNLYLHLITPLMALCTLYLPAPGNRLTRRQALLWGTAPVAVYAAVYLVLVVVLGAWPDVYGFNKGGRWYITMIIMAVFVTLLCLGMHALRELRLRGERA